MRILPLNSHVVVVHMYSTCSFSSWQQQNIHLLSNKHLLYSIIINEWSSIQLFDNMLHVHENGQQGRLESRLVIPQNNFDKTLTFNRSSFHHSIQEINEIWYPRSLIITLPGHQVSLTAYKKWWNGEWLSLMKIICGTSAILKIRSHTCILGVIIIHTHMTKYNALSNS